MATMRWIILPIILLAALVLFFSISQLDHGALHTQQMMHSGELTVGSSTSHRLSWLRRYRGANVHPPVDIPPIDSGAPPDNAPPSDNAPPPDSITVTDAVPPNPARIASEKFSDNLAARAANASPGPTQADFDQYAALPSGADRVAELRKWKNPQARQAFVRNAIRHAFERYAEKCFGQDDLLPISGSCQNWLGSGNTIIDSMSTLWLAGLKDLFDKGGQWIEKELDFASQSSYISHFETVIRSLGGLLSAFDLSGRDFFLTQATNLATRLKPAFSTQSGMPMQQVNLAAGTGSGGGNTLADVGTVQMEYVTLGKRGGDNSWRDISMKTYKLLAQTAGENQPHPGLYKYQCDTGAGICNGGHVTFGAMADSYYEYLIKLFVLTGKKHHKLKELFLTSMEGMYQHLLKVSPMNLTYIGFWPDHGGKWEHLQCFLGGMMGLASQAGIVDSEQSAKFLETGKELTKTCYMAYQGMATGVGAETWDLGERVGVQAQQYILRPEAMESIFYMWRITKDPIYREWGWNMFQAWEQYCRVTGGYAGLHNVQDTSESGNHQDKMESFFIAETLKYTYLLFSEDEVLPMAGINDNVGKPNYIKADKYYVFNTEAHPVHSWDDGDATLL